MIVEMLVLVLMAVAAFAYVLAPVVRPRREVETVEDTDPASAEDEAAEAVAAEKQPVPDRS